MKQYLDALKHIKDNGQVRVNRTGVDTTGVFGYQNRYDLREGFPLITTKKMFTKGIIQELVWFLQGRTDNQWLNERGVTIWDEWATEEACAKFGRAAGDLGPIYGFQWRHFGAHYIDSRSAHSGFDQIKWLSREMTNNPNSRRLIVTGWNPRDAAIVALPPCHTFWHVYISDGLLDLQLYQRSADTVLGVPFNIASYSLLAELLAFTHGLKARYFIHTFGDLHIYNNHDEQVALQLTREPYKLPTIKLNDRLKDRGFQGILDFTYKDVTIEDYQSHPTIKAPVAI